VSLNTFNLKVIAVIAMLIDHIAYALIPASEPMYYIMRMIGRIAAPLFWFCFVEGYKHTSNKKKYVVRLTLASLVMIIGNSIMRVFVGSNFTIGPLSPNIFLTMLLMFMVLACIEKSQNTTMKYKIHYLSFGLMLCLIVGFYAEYGWIAAFSILCFYFIPNKYISSIGFLIINSLFSIIDRLYLQIFAALAILLLVNYNSEKPKHSLKWFFYLFYPIHLWGLMLLSRIF
jgi:hypothetical protein